MIRNIVAYCVNRPLLNHLLVIMVVWLGLWALQNTHREARPNIDLDRLTVTTAYPGASPEDVELYVTAPIERELESLSGIEKVLSASREGVSVVTVYIDPEYRDKEGVKDDIQEALDRVQDFPDEVEDRPVIFEYKTTEFSILMIGLVNSKLRLLNDTQRFELQKYLRILEDQLLSLKAVPRLDRLGYREEEVQIRVHPDQLDKHYIAMQDITDALRNHNVRISGGSLDSSVSDGKIVTFALLEDIGEVDELRLRSTFDGAGYVKLGQVADVVQGFERERSKLKVNGFEGIALRVVKSETVDGLVADQQIKEQLKRFEEQTLKGTDYQIVLYKDRSIDTRNKLNIVTNNALLGMVLVLIVLLLFLDLRTAFWTAVGIPIALAFAMIFIKLFDKSLNNLTLAGAVIVLGMVVDDAIVIAENINRLQRKGMNYVKAAIDGALPMVLPVLASITTTIVAFLPLYLLPGVLGKFISHIPIVIVLILIGSFLECVLILPGHLSHSWHWLDRLKKVSPLASRSDKGHWFDRVELWYERRIQTVLRWRWAVLVAFIVLFVGAFGLGKQKLKFVLFPNEEVTELRFYGSTPDGTSREESAVRMQQVEDIIKPYLSQGVKSYVTNIAQNQWGRPANDNDVLMVIELLPESQRELKADQFLDLWKEPLDNVSGFEKKRFTKRGFGPGSGNDIEIVIADNDDAMRKGAAQAIADALESIEHVSNVELDVNEGKVEHRLKVNMPEAARLKVTPLQIGFLVRTAFEGAIPTRLQTPEEEIDFRVILDKAYREDVDKVLDLTVRNRDGKLIPLRHVLEMEERSTYQTIARRDNKRQTIVTADVDKDKITPLEVGNIIEQNILPGIRQHYPTAMVFEDGNLKDSREMKARLLNATGIAFFLIYVVLALLLNSISKPFIILVAVPFGLVGIILTLLAHGKGQIGLFASIGGIGLMGVVVNDSIVLVSKLNREIGQKLEKSDLVNQVASLSKQRLRAIILTTLTTCAGLMPPAYGLGGDDAFVRDMTLVMSWGLVFATLITLVLVPSLYLIREDIQRLAKS